MGLKATIASAVASGFAALGDLQETVTYNVYSTSSTYNPTTGTVTRTETQYSVAGLFLDYKKRDIDGQQIKPLDNQFMIQQAVLPVAPTLQDRIVRSTGKEYEVISIEQDPATATWTLQVRGRNG
jgi:hypothetical protein